MKKKRDFQSYLRKQVSSVYGSESIEIQDCKKISIEIFIRHRNYISESSIKRFFGFLPGPYLPSPFVLNSLSQFAGFNCWDEFLQRIEAKKHQNKKCTYLQGRLNGDYPA